MNIKRFSLCLLLCLLLGMTSVFASCGGGEDAAGAHEHTFAAEWSSNERRHWHAATCEHFGQTSGGANHTFVGSVCTVCGYGNGAEEPDPDDPDPMPDPVQDVKRIRVKTSPTKKLYLVGDTFDPTGGVLTVTYDDNSTAEVPMTDPAVTFTSFSMATAGTKNFNVVYGGKTAMMTITVTDVGYTITYHYNYEGAPEDKVERLPEGSELVPETPVREGYSFYTWYIGADYKEEYDFTQPLSADAELYAFWKKDGATYVDFTVDYNYYGPRIARYSYPAEQGATVTQPAAPERNGYRFDGWYTDAGGSAPFDFSQAITAATTVYAKWTRTFSGTEEYTFEAEDTNFMGKSGPSWSGSASGPGMIYKDTGSHGASGYGYVSHLYKQNNSLEFYFTSDVAVNNVTIKIRVATELPDEWTYDNSMMQVLLNGTPLNYDSFTLTPSGETDVATGQAAMTNFQDYMLTTTASLKEGANELQIKIVNNKPTAGTTYTAAAPVIDCIKITTSAVLDWDESKGLPVEDNY